VKFQLDPEVATGLKYGTLLGAVVLLLALFVHRGRSSPPAGPATAPAIAAPSAPMAQPDFGGERPGAAALRVARWVMASGDNGHRVFVILDKQAARAYVFEPDGRLAGAAPVLLGSAIGDDTVPGIGNKTIEGIAPSERTTPAGRFISEPGRDADLQTVVWVDYDAALSMHRVFLGTPAEHRAQRLASPTIADNRISWGCINMPWPFFNKVLWPRLGHHHGVIYILPEQKTLEQVFPALARQAPAA
jgi:hypothetical protein